TVCDPACGSGAYLLGMLHELLDLRHCLFAAKNLDPATNYERKLEIIKHNLYGVDKDPFAVNIARLRLWLSLAVEHKGEKPEPLPNLNFRIEVGDSLTAPDPSRPDPSVDFKLGFRHEQVSEYLRLKMEYMTAHGNEKRALFKRIDELKRQIALWTHGGNS